MPPVPSVLRIIHKGVYQSTPWITTLHARYSGAQPTSGQLDALCSSIGSVWNTHLAVIHGTTVTLQRVEAIDLTALDAASGFSTMTYPGTRAGSSHPVNVALVMSQKVNYRWRGGHIRCYWPASVGGDLVSGRLWTSSFQTLINTQFNSWFGAFNTLAFGGGTLKLVGVRYQGKNDPGPFPKPLDVVNVIAHTRADSQRRRLGKELV